MKILSLLLLVLVFFPGTVQAVQTDNTQKKVLPQPAAQPQVVKSISLPATLTQTSTFQNMVVGPALSVVVWTKGYTQNRVVAHVSFPESSPAPQQILGPVVPAMSAEHH
jgi:ABC-type sulfate transport system permease component